MGTHGHAQTMIYVIAFEFLGVTTCAYRHESLMDFPKGDGNIWILQVRKYLGVSVGISGEIQMYLEVTCPWTKHMEIIYPETLVSWGRDLQRYPVMSQTVRLMAIYAISMFNKIS